MIRTAVKIRYKLVKCSILTQERRMSDDDLEVRLRSGDDDGPAAR